MPEMLAVSSAFQQSQHLGGRGLADIGSPGVVELVCAMTRIKFENQLKWVNLLTIIPTSCVEPPL